MLADRNVGVLLRALSHGELDQRPGHGVCDPAEIPRWKRIVTGSFQANIETDSQRHRSGCGYVLLKAWEEFA
jgi:hypothetical protein